ncbi:MAG: ABC transporter ATP-binding protein [Lachnospiraceae bacterium]|nr:ABC transporter ATP-binding protein [Lachnospiraceae bacterium]
MNKADKIEWKYVVIFLKDFAKQNKDMLINSVLLSILGGVRPFISIVLMGFLLDAVYAGAGIEELLKYALIALGVNMLLRLIEARIREWYNQKNEYIKEIEAELLNRKSLSMDYEYLEEPRVQELRYKSQAEGNYIGMSGWLLYRFEQILTSVVSIVLALVIMIPLFISSKQGEGFICSWVSSVLLFAVVCVFVAINYKYNDVVARRSKDEYDKLTKDYNRRNYYLDKLAGIESQKDLRIYAQQELIENDIEVSNQNVIDGKERLASIFTKRECVGQGLSDLSGLLVYLFTGLRAYAGMITIGGVVTYASSILRFSMAVAKCAVAMANLNTVGLYCKDYVEYMSLSKRKYEGTIPMEKRRDNKFSVEFEHVSFRYPGTEQDIIKDLNLKFTIGEKMAIVGKNGSGKTTFIKLLCRLYDVTEGCIKVNGIDIRKFDYQEYCSLFAVVFQDFRMFAFPVGENVAASEQVDEERALDALTKAGLGERIATLPDGLNTYVGKDFAEEGVSFSGGEKQKMAIARAIYKNAPFVIMDEPTAALDPVSECEVFAGFDKMVGNKTAIYISHRLASCRFCEDILVFDKGTVVQRGSHEELVKQEGLYSDLWNAQAVYYA